MIYCAVDLQSSFQVHKYTLSKSCLINVVSLNLTQRLFKYPEETCLMTWKCLIDFV